MSTAAQPIPDTGLTVSADRHCAFGLARHDIWLYADGRWRESFAAYRGCAPLDQPVVRRLVQVTDSGKFEFAGDTIVLAGSALADPADLPARALLHADTLYLIQRLRTAPGIAVSVFRRRPAPRRP